VCKVFVVCTKSNDPYAPLSKCISGDFIEKEIVKDRGIQITTFKDEVTKGIIVEEDDVPTLTRMVKILNANIFKRTTPNQIIQEMLTN